MWELAWPLIAVYQSLIYKLTLRLRGQARSHI
jgi:hypothetical protein